MFSTPVQNLVVRHSSARFSGSQGYRLEGDQAHLNANVTVDDTATWGSDWALQLWACGAGNGQGGLQGIKVAEVVVGCLAIPGDSRLEGWATALPPAGQRAHSMVLALASGRHGLFDQIHDLAMFAEPENFRQPTLQGSVGYRFEQGQVELAVGAVANPRDASNVSGSLVLELWALPKAYEGGAFEGYHVAMADIGSIAGEGRLEGVQVTVPAALVPAGTWQLVLMLREWTAAGYVTRDYANFAAPLVVADAAPEASAAEQEPVAETVAAEELVAEVAVTKEPVAKEPVAKEPVAKEPVAKEPVAKEPVAKEPVAKAAVAEPVKAAQPSEPAKAAAPKAEPVASGKISVNRASAAELAAVKGLTKPVAAAIVASRPYATLDDLLRAKGMGAKLLKKLRDQLSL
jgi:DNA uptake protein ComE-like DNA-binding protein